VTDQLRNLARIRQPITDLTGSGGVGRFADTERELPVDHVAMDVLTLRRSSRGGLPSGSWPVRRWAFRIRASISAHSSNGRTAASLNAFSWLVSLTALRAQPSAEGYRSRRRTVSPTSANKAAKRPSPTESATGIGGAGSGPSVRETLSKTQASSPAKSSAL